MITLHHDVFIYTKPWDSRQITSLEVIGTNPSVGYHRWPRTGPLGAVMLLTASRQPPKDTTRHANEQKAPEKIPKPSDPHNYPPLCDIGLALSITSKNVPVEQHGIQYDNAVIFYMIFIETYNPNTHFQHIEHIHSLHSPSTSLAYRCGGTI